MIKSDHNYVSTGFVFTSPIAIHQVKWIEIGLGTTYQGLV